MDIISNTNSQIYFSIIIYSYFIFSLFKEKWLHIFSLLSPAVMVGLFLFSFLFFFSQIAKYGNHTYGRPQADQVRWPQRCLA